MPLGSNSLQVPTYVYSLQGPAIARGLTPSGDLLLAFAPDTAPAAAPSLDIPATGRKLLAQVTTTMFQHSPCQRFQSLVCSVLSDIQHAAVQKSTAPVPAPAQYTPVLAPACAISAGSAPVVAPIQVVRPEVSSALHLNFSFTRHIQSPNKAGCCASRWTPQSLHLRSASRWHPCSSRLPCSSTDPWSRCSPKPLP